MRGAGGGAWLGARVPARPPPPGSGCTLDAACQQHSAQFSGMSPHLPAPRPPGPAAAKAAAATAPPHFYMRSATLMHPDWGPTPAPSCLLFRTLGRGPGGGPESWGRGGGGGCLMSVFNMQPTPASFFLLSIILYGVDVFRA